MGGGGSLSSEKDYVAAPGKRTISKRMTNEFGFIDPQHSVKPTFDHHNLDAASTIVWDDEQNAGYEPAQGKGLNRLISTIREVLAGQDSIIVRKPQVNGTHLRPLKPICS